MGLMGTILPGAPWAGQDIVNRKVWNSLSLSLSLSLSINNGGEKLVKVDRLVSEHLRAPRRSNPHTLVL
jgi:hypothetical protein